MSNVPDPQPLVKITKGKGTIPSALHFRINQIGIHG